MPTDAHGNPASLRRRRRVWLMLGLVAVTGSAIAVIPRVGSSQESVFKLTHIVGRGDLILTVTEQGTLESAVNTEIKCKVRDKDIPITWVIEGGSRVGPGDVLVRLATLAYEDRINAVSRWYHGARSSLERSQADLARAELAVSEYLEGRYLTELMTLEKDLAVAQSNLRTAQNMLAHAQMMAERGYVSELEVEQQTFAVTQAELNVGVKRTEIDVLKDYTKAMELETLNGELTASKARYEAAKSEAKSAEVQLGLCEGDLENCVVKAEKSGMVIYATGKPWEHVPRIEEGATVYMGQTLLFMPDLSQMQVKVGIRESFIDRMKPGLKARVSLPNKTLDGTVSSVASVTGPTGWWNGNKVRYDTIVSLPSIPGLRPGMSAEVVVTLAEYEDVLTIPVAAIVETTQGDFCWVKTPAGAERRSLTLGGTNNSFTVVEAGLKVGDEVVLNPLAIKEAETLAQKPPAEPGPPESQSLKAPSLSKPSVTVGTEPSGKPKSEPPVKSKPKK